MASKKVDSITGASSGVEKTMAKQLAKEEAVVATMWQRARTPEKIEERKNAVIEAAKDLFAKEEYHDISLNRIAEQAGFTKSNVYRYFSSREEIFLLIYSDLAIDWSKSTVSYYKTLKNEVSVDAFVDGFVQVATKKKQFVELSHHLFSALEKNSSEDELLAFKKLTMEILGEHVHELQKLFPELSSDEVLLFLRVFQTTSSCYWQASHPNKLLKKIYAKDEFKALSPDFERDLKVTLVTILNGIRNKGSV